MMLTDMKYAYHGPLPQLQHMELSVRGGNCMCGEDWRYSIATEMLGLMCCQKKSQLCCSLQQRERCLQFMICCYGKHSIHVVIQTN